MNTPQLWASKVPCAAERHLEEAAAILTQQHDCEDARAAHLRRVRDARQRPALARSHRFDVARHGRAAQRRPARVRELEEVTAA